MAEAEVSERQCSLSSPRGSRVAPEAVIIIMVESYNEPAR